jgi:hypothetical protein
VEASGRRQAYREYGVLTCTHATKWIVARVSTYSRLPNTAASEVVNEGIPLDDVGLRLAQRKVNTEVPVVDVAVVLNVASTVRVICETRQGSHGELLGSR